MRSIKLKPNPVMLKELRGQMRGWRAFVVLTIYLILLSCVTGGLYLSVYAASTATAGMGGGMIGATAGRTLFGGIVLLERSAGAFAGVLHRPGVHGGLHRR